MESPLVLTIQVLAQIIIFGMLLFGVYLTSRRGGFSSWIGLAKRKNIIEQQLVFEAISAIAYENDYMTQVHSIGTHLADLSGFNSWILWMRDEKGPGFSVSDYFQTMLSESELDTASQDDPKLYDWVTRNPEPVLSLAHIHEFADSDSIKAALKSMSNGIMVPLVESGKVLGFIILGGEKKSYEERTPQFYSLFGTSVAIIIRKTLLHMQEQILRRNQQRVENLVTIGQVAANLAHEIRNPLTFIQSAYDVIKSDTVEAAKKEEINRRVQGEIARVNNRIEELLSLARIDSTQFTKLHINFVIQNSVKMAEFKAHESDIKIIAHYDEHNPVIKGDSDKLSQLFQNLLINGIQAIEGSGEIKVTCTSDENFATIDIEDTGSGIELESVDKIFDPFYSRKKKGTGLGLSISFSVARAHDGNLELLKTSSEGTCFRVTLPLL